MCVWPSTTTTVPSPSTCSVTVMGRPASRSRCWLVREGLTDQPVGF
jgi:hypothetical protein